METSSTSLKSEELQLKTRLLLSHSHLINPPNNQSHNQLFSQLCSNHPKSHQCSKLLLQFKFRLKCSHCTHSKIHYIRSNQ